MLPRILSSLAVLLLTLLLPQTAPAQIYADLQVGGGVTGTFTISLEYQKAPGAVANFIGLATGQRDWLDLTTGALRHDPYYNGVTFHRVLSGFVDQTGSRSGDSTDGPGYTFRDEFDPTLRHDAPYVVSMANSGKHTNGAQFFITVAPTPWLNDVHTIFGHVISGQSVIGQINARPTDAIPKPTPTVIQAIMVYGPSLADFNLDSPRVPKLSNAHPVLLKNGSTFTLASDRLPFSEYTLYHGANLASWTKFSLGYFASNAPTTDLDVTGTTGGAAYFYRMARADYSTAKNPFMPNSFGSKTLTFTGNFYFPISTVAFNADATGGTWAFPGTPYSGPVAIVQHLQDKNFPQLNMQWDTTPPFSFDFVFYYVLDYTSATGGTFTGQTNVSGYPTIAGTFTSTP